MNDTNKTSTTHYDQIINNGSTNLLCNRSLSGLIPQNTVSNVTDLIEDKETYLERSLGFLIVGSIGTFANLIAILVLISSVRIRKKIINTLIIHQSVTDFLACVFSGWYGPS